MEKVTIVELEQACKKIKGTIFYYFKSKQILFEEVIESLSFHHSIFQHLLIIRTYFWGIF